MATIKASARHKARRFALQALYQWLIAEMDPATIETQFIEREQALQKADIEYFKELLHQIPTNRDDLDKKYEKFLDRNLSQISPIELIILRIGSYEMSTRPDIPFRVVINEAVELAKVFGAEGSHKYINSILDRLAKELRPSEVTLYHSRNSSRSKE